MAGLVLEINSYRPGLPQTLGLSLSGGETRGMFVSPCDDNILITVKIRVNIRKLSSREAVELPAHSGRWYPWEAQSIRKQAVETGCTAMRITARASVPGLECFTLFFSGNLPLPNPIPSLSSFQT